MKKTLRTLIAFMLCLGMSISTVSAYAAENQNNRIISIAEFEEKMQEECEKYNIGYEVLEYDPNVQITQADLDASLQRVREYGEKKLIEAETDESEMVQNEESQVPGPARIMPVTKNRSQTFNVTNVFGTGHFKLTTNVTVNAQNNGIISVNSYKVQKSGLSLNLDSYKINKITYTKDKPSTGWVSFNVDGVCEFVYTDPLLGLTASYTDEFSKAVQVNCI